MNPADTSNSDLNPEEDPVLAMVGVGKHLWQQESGDEFIKKERADWVVPLEP